MPKITSYHKAPIEDLKDPLEAGSYIEVVLGEGNPIILSKALRNIIETQGGIDKFSDQIQQCYEKLDHMLLEKCNIEFSYLSTLLDALGLQFAVKVKSA